MPNALITGATGFVGQRLVQKLGGAKVLTRTPEKSTLSDCELFAWNPKRPAPAQAFKDVDWVFHLAGESVANGRWNKAKKQEIYESRINSTQILVQTISDLETKPKVLVCASAVGFYGDRGEEKLEESSEPGVGFLAELCQHWEAEAAKLQGVRVVNVRIGIVLGKGGGAIDKMLTPFKLGLGGRLGSGAQWMPWIHLNDVVGLLIHAAQNESLQGPINAVSPNPVTNTDFTTRLGTILKRPTVFPMPEALLYLVVGEFAKVLVSSQRVLPLVAQQSGYQFQYPDIDSALRACM